VQGSAGGDSGKSPYAGAVHFVRDIPVTEIREVTIEESEEFHKIQAEFAELEGENQVLLEKLEKMEMSEEAIIERLMKRFPSLAAGAEA